MAGHAAFVREQAERRERIAAGVAAALAACPHKPNGDLARAIALAAIEIADALIAELDK